MKQLKNKQNKDSDNTQMQPSGKRFNKKPAFNKKPYKDDNKIPGIKVVPLKRRHVVDETTKSLRRLYNKIRDKETKAPAKHDTITKMLKIIGTNIKQFCFKHDGSRMLQACLKHGNKENRLSVYNQLKDIYYDLIIKNYSIYLASKMFKMGENKEREEIVTHSIIPHFAKLLKSSKGQAFLNFIFKYSNAKIHEIFFNEYVRKYLKISLDLIKESFKPKDPQNEANDAIIIEQQTTFGEENVRKNIVAHLEKQLEKSVHKTFIFQYFLDRIFDSLDTKLKLYISELFDDDTDEFITNKFGMELSCKLFVVGSTKTRKKIIKKVKDRMEELTKNEHSLLFLIKVLLFCDDTKMIGKYIIKPIQHLINEELLSNKGILKLVMNIIIPFNKRANNNYEQKVLEYNNDSSSKKEMSKRQDEIMFFIFDDLLANIKSNVNFFLFDSVYSPLLIDFLTYLDQRNNVDILNEILNSISSIIDDDFKAKGINCILSNDSGHFTIIKLIKKILKEFQNKNLDFIKSIADIIRLNLAEFLDTKAIFIMINIIENNDTKKFLFDDVKKFKTQIVKKSGEEKLAGYKVLTEILNK